jgi:glycosyltransferase involved in cell wall biosynthesis
LTSSSTPLRRQEGEALVVTGAAGPGEHLSAHVPAVAGAGFRCEFLAAGRGAWRAVRTRLRSRLPALVHAHGLDAARACWLGGLGSPVPLLVTLDETPCADEFASLAGQARRWLLGRVLAGAAAVVAPGEDGRAALLRLFPNLRRRRSRVHAAPPGVAHTAADAVDLRAELGLGADVTLVGFTGAFAPEGGFPLLMEAASRLARYGGVAPFHVVALAAREDRDRQRLEVERRGLAGHVTLRDAGPDLGAAVDALDLLVVPATRPPAAGPVLRALGLGVPVLGSDCPGLREWLSGTPSRRFRAGEAASLETALREALARPWDAEALAYAPAARRRFDARRATRLVVDLYRRLSGAPATRS